MTSCADVLGLTSESVVPIIIAIAPKLAVDADLGAVPGIRSRSLEAEAEGRRHRERHSRSPVLERSLPPPPTAKEQVRTPPLPRSIGVSVCLPPMAASGGWLGRASAQELWQQENEGRITAVSVLSADLAAGYAAA